MKLIASAALAALSFAGIHCAAAAGSQYSFSTGTAFNFVGVVPLSSDPATAAMQTDIANNLAAQLAGTSVAGTFLYDSSAPQTSTAADGAFIYAGYALPGGGFSSSFTALSGSVSGGSLSPAFGFADPRGLTVIGNNTFQSPAPCPVCPLPPKSDIFQFLAEPGSAAFNPHNISSTGTLAGLTLYNVRMFWITGVQTPELIPDFLDNQSLPGSPPAFHGRLVLDFVQDSATGTPQFDAIYDSLAVAAAVPEPETYALLMAGLSLLGLSFRPRLRQRAARTRPSPARN